MERNEKIARFTQLTNEVQELRASAADASPDEKKRLNGIIRGKSIRISQLKRELFI